MAESTTNLKHRLVELTREIDEVRKANGSYFFKPFEWQKKLINAIPGMNVIAAIAPNKIGKTGVGANIVTSWALGHEPWSSKPSSLGIAPPVRIRVTGEDWTHHIGETLVPEMKKWCPRDTYTTKKNNLGIEYLWRFNNGSTVEFMSYEQDISLFESWLGHAWLADEPPPRPVYTSMSRGLFSTGGKILMTLTPLKEAWILDEIVLSPRPDISVHAGLTILDNDILKAHDEQVLRDMGMTYQPIKDYFNALLKYDVDWLKRRFPVKYQEFASQLYIERFIRDIPPDERDARILGTFKHLTGLVYKEFEPRIHVIEPFVVPPDWPVVPLIDLHIKKPQALLYCAFDPRGNEYVIDEDWRNMPPDDIAYSIIDRKVNKKFKIDVAGIDPLSKGDAEFFKNRQSAHDHSAEVESSFAIIDKLLARHRIRLVVASKDKESGIRNVKNALKGLNNLPSLFFFKNCERTLYEIPRYTYDDDTEKPTKIDDDMMENLYRSTLMGIKWRPEHLPRIIQPNYAYA